MKRINHTTARKAPRTTGSAGSSMPEAPSDDLSTDVGLRSRWEWKPRKSIRRRRRDILRGHKLVGSTLPKMQPTKTSMDHIPIMHQSDETGIGAVRPSTSSG